MTGATSAQRSHLHIISSLSHCNQPPFQPPSPPPSPQSPHSTPSTPRHPSTDPPIPSISHSHTPSLHLRQVLRHITSPVHHILHQLICQLHLGSTLLSLLRSPSGAIAASLQSHRSRDRTQEAQILPLVRPTEPYKTSTNFHLHLFLLLVRLRTQRLRLRFETDQGPLDCARSPRIIHQSALHRHSSHGRSDLSAPKRGEKAQRPRFRTQGS
ncbi:hypothetical protein BT69DRAFT_695751 [Atractiella rhizophila]|nr:hypothetical protein BT69DRAFT_695751 [Atractiella rhizophila]